MVDRVQRWAKVGRFRRRAHGKFVHVRLAQDDRTGCRQLFNHAGVVLRHKILQHVAGAGRAQPFRADVVLHCHRNALKHTDLLTAGKLRIDGIGSRQRRLRAQRDVGVDLWIDLGKISLRQRAGCRFPTDKGVVQCVNGVAF